MISAGLAGVDRARPAAGNRAERWTKSEIDPNGSWQNYAAFSLEKYIFLPLARRNLPAHISAAPPQPTPVWHVCQPVADRLTYGKLK